MVDRCTWHDGSHGELVDMIARKKRKCQLGKEKVEGNHEKAGQHVRKGQNFWLTLTASE